ncbi:MAG: Gfo/Idh/MocA family oxidoreductase [Planctomycetales bacterium]|nr:Gfo/Idh/MocA family oxidoreductase [Planctomycetales bacterium]
MKPQNSSRRSFLKTTAGVGLCAATAPNILPGLYAQDSANDRLNVACIGVGGRGSGIGGQAADLGQLVACCDVDSKNANRFAEFHKERKGRSCKVYGDYREMFENEPGVDVVTIGTPDHWHVKIAIEAMKAGKHVYCEKPLTLTIAEGQVVQEAVKRYGKTFQVGTQQRSEFDMRFLKAVAIAHSGRLGKNLTAVSSVGTAASRSEDKEHPFGPFKTAAVPEGFDWDLWLGPAPAVDYSPERVGWNFRWWFEYSGGQVTDWGVHHTDIAFWALAGRDGQAVEAEGRGGFMGVERGMVLDFLLGKIPPNDMPVAWNVAHSFDVNIKLSTGNNIKLTSGDNQLLISGEEGRILVNRGRLTGKPVEDIDADPKAKQEIEDLMAELYGGELPKGHMRNFFDCVRSGKQPVANVRDHVRAVNACHLANIALLTERKLNFDPDAMQFANDDEANKLIRRENRDGYAING